MIHLIHREDCFNYALDGAHQGGNHQHCRQVNHDLVGEVVHVEEEGHEADEDQEEGLEKRVGDVVLHAPLEQDVHDGVADVAMLGRANGHFFVDNLVLDQHSFA